jgi:hypothetical protein
MRLGEAIVDFFQHCEEYQGPVRFNHGDNPNPYAQFGAIGRFLPETNLLEVDGTFTACTFDSTKVYVAGFALAAMIALIAGGALGCRRNSCDER